MDSRGEESHYIRGFRQRGNTPRQSREHRHHRRELMRFQIHRKFHAENIDQVALVVQESEVKLRLLEEEEVDARERRREVDKGKARML